jgi:hypothetical protein
MPNACNVEESLIGLSTLLVVKINRYTSPEEYYMKEWQVLGAPLHPKRIFYALAPRPTIVGQPDCRDK